ncbi:3-demethylubiquinone-9 3-methyltransferase [Thioalkalivibrio nitratireducens DSM 14787]|uniref:Ubiquinone biosynthesis O-methyltransferase n=1 Tax=Thioalkalivibrio nitratireducens (strain DSM 14787 / UNIQEM 213 / ALEN2) TaxID=1255043 RepID=L0DW35_THIND|nr:bifunctional 2-polyprenyl-6-hydroxyphenol methylase/3-demethylubiquinol 3-O-methyltransferase UbiG [Thioalkalivibrio nitratireducens]AGA33190.1 3-demethylubiquinone-9 3-methyltransferase [Thioalkalivibrio nitratireducens DSM 14787]
MTSSEAPREPQNVDPAELAKFTSRADDWWDPTGPFATLHAINPLRLNWIGEHAALHGQEVLDVGCGAGILTEAMALRGARVTGIDAGAEHLEIARAHAVESELEIAYHHTTAEAFAEHHAGRFAVVTCMEMLEHVPEPESALAALSRLVAPGGHLFLSTINRTPRAFVEAIVGAEYLLRLLPTGTHEYARFIRPSELAARLRAGGLEIRDLTGLTYSPITREYRLTPSVAVNYLLHAQRPDPGGAD